MRWDYTIAECVDSGGLQAVGDMHAAQPAATATAIAVQISCAP